MRNRFLVALGAAAGAAVACTTTRTVVETNAEPMPTASARMRDAAGRDLGTLQMLFTSTGTRLLGTLAGLPPGSHGFHVHEVGRCDATGSTPFESAGDHYNPAGRRHGTLNPAGPHTGDLPNVTVGADGRATLPDSGLTVTMNDTEKAGIFDTNGSALLLHASADDYRTDPSGNSGPRIACGVVTR
jgi:Cu-Zn family superoxide dismutase